MRIALLAFGTLVVGLLAILAFDDRPIALPTIAPKVEPICADAMHGRPPDLSWVAPHRFEKGGGREIQTITPGELPLHYGRLVRVAGVLHAEFEWVALYPSRAAMEEHPWRIRSEGRSGFRTSRGEAMGFALKAEAKPEAY